MWEKYSFLRTINWLTPPDNGKIVLQGDIIGSVTGKLTIKQTRLLNNFRARIGMVFQQFNVWPHLNVLENVIKAQVVVSKKNSEEAKIKAIKMLNEVGLKDKFDEWPDNLSGGQKQKTCNSKILSNGPYINVIG